MNLDIGTVTVVALRVTSEVLRTFMTLFASSGISWDSFLKVKILPK